MRTLSSLELFSELWALTERELAKFLRSPVIVLMMIIQPALWIGLFGKAFNVTGLLRIPEEVLEKLPPYVTQQVQQIVNESLRRLFGSPDVDYFSYMAVGMAAVAVLFAGFSGGMSMSWDRRLGYLEKLLAAPVRRESILLAKVLGASVRGLIQASLILLIAAPMGLRLRPAGAAGVALAALGLFALALGLSSLFTAVTVRVKSWEVQMATMNLLNLPLMFASRVLYPSSIMPSWLRPVAEANPLSHAADLCREALLYGNSVALTSLLAEALILAAFSGALLLGGLLVARRALETVE
ncbi:MAG: ABC transporter permease [Fervidicoccaceae archaeon]